MEKGEQGSAASVKAVEIGVAAVIFLFGALVVFDSVRVGAKWGDDGPQAGYFPLYVGLLICFASAAILVRALRDPVLAAESFVSREELKKILTVLVPTVVYVAVIAWLGSTSHPRSISPTSCGTWASMPGSRSRRCR